MYKSQFPFIQSRMSSFLHTKTYAAKLDLEFLFLTLLTNLNTCHPGSGRNTDWLSKTTIGITTAEVIQENLWFWFIFISYEKVAKALQYQVFSLSKLKYVKAFLKGLLFSHLLPVSKTIFHSNSGGATLEPQRVACGIAKDWWNWRKLGFHPFPSQPAEFC